MKPVLKARILRVFFALISIVTALSTARYIVLKLYAETLFMAMVTCILIIISIFYDNQIREYNEKRK